MRIGLIDFMSLDGVVQAPGGPEEDTDNGFEHGGWSVQYCDPDAMGSATSKSVETSDGLLFGRRTWQGMASAWPDRAGDPFADEMNSIQKYVASTTLTKDELTWTNSTLLPPDDVIGEVSRPRELPGGDILVWGSAQLAQDLIANDLVDEYGFMIEPVVLGGGKRLFPDDGTMRPLELVDTIVSNSGVQICTFRPI